MTPPVLPHFPSSESLRPEDAPLRSDPDLYAAEHGLRNLQQIYALAEKEGLQHPGMDSREPPFQAEEIVWLLARQADRRRNQIRDEHAGLNLNESSASRQASRCKELITYGENSLRNMPLIGQCPDLAWSAVDQIMLRLAVINDRGDYDYTGRFDRLTEEQITKEVEQYLQHGTQPRFVTLPFLNALFGTLHIAHILGLKSDIAFDLESHSLPEIPLERDAFVAAIRNLNTHINIAPGRTEFVDQLVRGSNLLHLTVLIDMKRYDHATDTLQDIFNNAHEQELLPSRLVSLGYKYRQSILSQASMYPPDPNSINAFHGTETLHHASWQNSGLAHEEVHQASLSAPPMRESGFDRADLPSLHVLSPLPKEQDVDTMKLSRAPPVRKNGFDIANIRPSPVQQPPFLPMHKSIDKVQSPYALPMQKNGFDSPAMSRSQPFGIHLQNSSKSSVKSAWARPLQNSPLQIPGFDCVQGFNNIQKQLEESMPNLSPSLLDEEITMMKTVEEHFEKNPFTKAGREPQMLSRMLPVADAEASRSPTRASQLPTGMPKKHAAKMGLFPDFSAHLGKVPALGAQLPPAPVPFPLPGHHYTLASMLAQEREEAEYARWKCARAEKALKEGEGEAAREIARLRAEGVELKREVAALMGKCWDAEAEAKEWREKCELWEENYAAAVEQNFLG